MKDMQPNRPPASFHKNVSHRFDHLVLLALERIAKYADHYTNDTGAHYLIPVEKASASMYPTKPLH